MHIEIAIGRGKLDHRTESGLIKQDRLFHQVLVNLIGRRINVGSRLKLHNRVGECRHATHHI